MESKNISKKEWWIGMIVALVVLSIAGIFEPTLKDVAMKEIRTYQSALQVDNDPKTYNYAIKTNIGNVLAYGNITALEPVSIPELKQQYGAILKVKEHYTKHTRQVCVSKDKKGNCTKYEDEDYYRWDTVGYQNFISAQWNFLDAVFSSSQLEMPTGSALVLDDTTMNSSYKGFYDSWHLYENTFIGLPSGNDRYYFVTVPVSFVCTIFSRFFGNIATDPISGSQVMHVYVGLKPAQIIQQKKDSLIILDFLYYLLSVVLCVGLWYWLAYDYLDIQ